MSMLEPDCRHCHSPYCEGECQQRPLVEGPCAECGGSVVPGESLCPRCQRIEATS